MGLPSQARDAISKEIEAKFEFLFEKLNVGNTKEAVLKNTSLKRVITRKRGGHVEMSGEGAD
jgi:hypothetical protein